MEFVYPTRGPGRPQILLLGNGLERCAKQMDWDALIDAITAPNAVELTEEQRERIPFPLLYQLLSTPTPAPSCLSEGDLRAEELRLRVALKKLKHTSTELLDLLPGLEADHILTTNYSYCVERAFFPRSDFTQSQTRSRKRFRLGEREGVYKMQTGYLAGKTGLWHIHGECADGRSIVLGHDRYGRLLTRIEGICSGQFYSGNPEEIRQRAFQSWPELFLHGDVYILGFGMDESEFDLWWLLRRKQRERYADGRVFYYDHPNNGSKSTKHLLLTSCGVELVPIACEKTIAYEDFYKLALDDIRCRIAKSRRN